MPQHAEYKLVAGSASQINGELARLATQNWKPILMSSGTAGSSGAIVITGILEHVLGT